MFLLFLACEQGHSNCIKILLNSGADIDSKNKNEDTRNLHSFLFHCYS